MRTDRVRQLAAVFLVTVSLAAAQSAFAQKEYGIALIQGKGNISPKVREVVRVTGIVTARTRTGFFIQTPDDKTDNDPATSEGIFVFTRSEPKGEAAVGNMVSVTGTVTEFTPRAEPFSLSITEISMQDGRDMIQVLSKGNELPKPIVVGADVFKANNIDDMERLEGMRVVVSELLVTAPTGGRVDTANETVASNGTFYGVVKGLRRPFREPGYDLYEYIFLNDKQKGDLKKNFPQLKLWDANPERLRIESTAQLGSQPIDVPALTELKNVTGVVHYSYRTYSILLDPGTRPAVAGYQSQVNLPVANPNEFTIAGSNIENFFDDEDDPDIKEEIVTTSAFEKRLKKISNAFRTIMKSPDIVGTMEIENQKALQRLCDKINADTAASGKPDPKYQAIVLKGNDGRGINVGLMIRSTRVKVVETIQIGKDEKFNPPGGSEDAFLNDRPSLAARLEVSGPQGKAFPVTVIVNHLKSFLGYYDEKRQDAVRMKKRLQSEMIARFIQQRQKADPSERIVLVGDFNAFQFNDGVVDVIGAIKGKPAAKGEVMNPSDDLVDPDLTNLVDLINPMQQYSYCFDGNAQVLDHVLVNSAMMPFAVGLGYGRVNADFPESFRADGDRPERYSDHDPAVAYFSFEAAPPSK
ncbi:MAG: hypothetical protein KF736_11285 [Acidobacteria bacterium]|nr:hypothetical protein [Acidobacteriota bacterium]MCW5950014.1 hypothetical protein [Pyrinomonadaceae bacterium]